MAEGDLRGFRRSVRERSFNGPDKRDRVMRERTQQIRRIHQPKAHRPIEIAANPPEPSRTDPRGGARAGLRPTPQEKGLTKLEPL